METERPGLPPRSAGASLKQAVVADQVFAITVFPAFCGGLIEAASPAIGLRRRTRVFPRVLRGPH